MTLYPKPTGGLFAEIKPRARATDPSTSHEAAKAAKAAAPTHAKRILDDLRRVPGSTASEIAARLDGLDRYAVNRRLPDLEEAGLVTRGKKRLPRGGLGRCRETTWYAKEGN